MSRFSKWADREAWSYDDQTFFQKSPIQQESPHEMSYWPSEGITTSPQNSRQPDPPDPNRSGYDRYGKPTDDIDRGSRLLNGMETRLTKIGFPRFDGTELREWIYRCEQFFMLDGTPPEMKVRLASLHMVGTALQWHHIFVSNRFGNFPSWPEYIVAVSARFGETYDDPLAELVGLKQSGDLVIVYLENFEKTLTWLSLPQAHCLSIFLSNMDPHLALQAQKFEVKYIAVEAQITKLHESELVHTPIKTQQKAPFSPSQRPNNPLYYQKTNTTPLLPSPIPSSSYMVKPQFIPKNTSDKAPRKFCYQEIHKRNNKGLCMFCDEPYTPGHHLKHRR